MESQGLSTTDVYFLFRVHVQQQSRSRRPGHSPPHSHSCTQAVHLYSRWGQSLNKSMWPFTTSVITSHISLAKSSHVAPPNCTYVKEGKNWILWAPVNSASALYSMTALQFLSSLTLTHKISGILLSLWQRQKCSQTFQFFPTSLIPLRVSESHVTSSGQQYMCHFGPRYLKPGLDSPVSFPSLALMTEEDNRSFWTRNFLWL